MRKYVPLLIENANGDMLNLFCKYTYKKGISIGLRCTSSIYSEGYCKKHFNRSIVKINNRNKYKDRDRCPYSTIKGSCNRYKDKNTVYCKYHKNFKNKNKNEMQLVKYVPFDIFLLIKQKEEKRRQKRKEKKKKYLERRKTRNKHNTLIKKPIYDNYCPLFNINTFTYVCSPFKKNINIEGKEYNCIKWRIKRIQSLIELTIEHKNNIKTHEITFKEFESLLLKEYPHEDIYEYMLV